MAFVVANRLWHGIWYAWRVWHGIWYSLASKAWYMIWPCGHGMVYAIAWWAWHGILYSLAGLPWYMVCPGSYGMIYGITWQGMGLYMMWHGGMT